MHSPYEQHVLEEMSFCEILQQETDFSTVSHVRSPQL